MNLDPRRPFRLSGRVGARTAESVRRHPRRAAGLALAGLVGVLVMAWLVLGRTGSPGNVAATDPAFTFRGGWSLVELQRHIQAGDVEAITAAPVSTTGPASQQLLARTTSGQVVPVDLSVSPGEAVDALTALGYGRLLTNEALAVSPQIETGGGTSLFAILFPLMMIGVTVLLVVRLSRRTGPTQRDGATFRTIMPAAPVAEGAASGDDAPAQAFPSVRLADVAGCDEAKLELTETIEFLRTPERFHKLGARIPRGIMLYGPPGTGKTMLARAVAAEAGVPFHHASGSEFVEKYVGVGAKRVRELFAQARKMGRGVIFFDEFDAIGKARGGPNSHEEREQTLNQLLVELDGFGTTDDVVVIAATNRLDTLDSAVLRPGRFNRKIHVGLPDVQGRREILAVHARNKPIAETIDLEETARKTYGFSGAMLADLLNEAAILAARRGGETISAEDVHGGWLKVAVGTSRRRSMDERERSIIAAHEVGHAICGKVHGDKRKVEEISLFAHGEALGVTVSSQEDNDLPSESDLRARLIALMGGRAAEEILFHEVTGGASNDFEAANKIATAMVTKWGMGRDPEAADGGISGRGSLSFLVPTGERTLPSDVQAAATRAIRSILDEAYAEACRTLIEHMETLRRCSAYLVEHERVDGETFDELFEGRRVVPKADDEWRAATARPRAWGEIVDLAARRVAAITPGPAPAPVTVVAAANVASPHIEAAEPAETPAAISGVVSATVAEEPAASIATISEAPVEAAESVESARSPGAASVGTAPARGRLRVRRTPARRVRRAAATLLGRAERWLRSGELEADRL
ncbi:MAG TPA: AAA family ATPase [Candidatus Limnocylindrales bacterium]|nr:AAA family ATPase [Candidatus Limnocylindrales bacterium]